MTAFYLWGRLVTDRRLIVLQHLSTWFIIDVPAKRGKGGRNGDQGPEACEGGPDMVAGYAAGEAAEKKTF